MRKISLGYQPHLCWAFCIMDVQSLGHPPIISLAYITNIAVYPILIANI